MDTLKYICEKYKVNLKWPSPFYVGISRFTDIPKLFTELGFKVGAEIGVESGTYSECLLKSIPGLKLYGIDLWKSYGGYKDFVENNLAQAEINAKTVAEKYNLIIKKGWSDERADDFQNESLDFVFIDGNHAYEWVVQDIALWSKKVRKGGIIYGHDFDDYSGRRRWGEMHVKQAVEGWVKSYKIHPLIIINGDRNKSWMYVKS